MEFYSTVQNEGNSDTGNAKDVFFFFNFFIVISPIPFFFLLYSMVTRLHMHVYILFSPIIVLRHK